MSVSAETFGSVRNARLSAAAATHIPAPAQFVVQPSAMGFSRRGAADWRTYFAIACSVLVHVWLLGRADTGHVGPVAVEQSAPLAVRIRTVVAPPAPTPFTEVKPEPMRSEPPIRPAPPLRSKPLMRLPEKPVQPQARSEPAPAVAEPAPARSAPATTAAQTQAAATSPTTTKAQIATATANNELPLITEPRYRRPPQPPEYPPQSVRRNEEGTALIRARISLRGEVIEARVFESSGSARLDKSALAAVQRWLFVPALRDGQPSEAWVQVPVQFRLDE